MKKNPAFQLVFDTNDVFELFTAYRFQIAGYRDEIEYKALRKVEAVSNCYSVFSLNMLQTLELKLSKFFNIGSTIKPVC